MNSLKPYDLLASTPYSGYTDFFAAKGYIYPTEYLQSNYMRRIRESDGFYEEEWIVYRHFQSYYSWCYDWMNNNIYAGAYKILLAIQKKFPSSLLSIQMQAEQRTPQKVGPST